MLIFEVLIAMFVVFVSCAAIAAFRGLPASMTASSELTDSPLWAPPEEDEIHLEPLDLEPAASDRERRISSLTR